jgi:hypothetical protein
VLKLVTLESGLGLETTFVSTAKPSQTNVPYSGFDRQAVKTHLCQRGCRKSRNDIAASDRALKPIELLGADNHHGVLPV